MVKHTVSVILILFSGALTGQTFLLKGVILDQQNDEPVEFVSVISENHKAVAQTDIRGYYEDHKYEG